MSAAHEHPDDADGGIEQGSREIESLRKLKALEIALLCVFAASAVLAQTERITAWEAKKHLGEKATVCGRVAGIHFVSSGKGQPTFIHFEEQYPNQIFTTVIWGSDRPKFGRPEVTYRDKNVCVTGKITSYLGIPEIVSNDPKQIEVQK